MPIYTEISTTLDIGSTPGGAATFANPNNVTGSPDASVATASLFSEVPNSNYLYLSNFGFEVDSTDEIVGIEVTIRFGDTTGSGINFGKIEAYALKATLPTPVVFLIGSVNASGNSLTDHVFGSPTSLFGTTWTPAEINSSGFGVRFRARIVSPASASTINVDSASITVYTNLGAQKVWTQYVRCEELLSP